MKPKVETSTEEEILDSQGQDAEDVTEETEPAEGSDTEEETTEDDSTDDSETDSETEEEDSDAEDVEDVEDDEVTVTIGEEDSPPEEDETKAAPTWVKELRKSNRELKRQLREKDEKLKAVQGFSENNEPEELGKKPKLEDFDYDGEKFEVGLENWFERKRKNEEYQAKIKAENENQQKQWQERISFYDDAKAKLKVRDYEEAEQNAQEALSVTQLGMIVQGAEDPALVTYALGKNPKKLTEISKITDPVKFAFTVAKLETQLKVQGKKRPASSPEKKVKSSGGTSGSVDSTLENLRSEAANTGDYTKVIQYKNQLKKTK
jgi:hypothetical protein